MNAPTLPVSTAAALRSQRVDARGAIRVHLGDGVTRLSALAQTGAAKIRLPRVAAGHALEAVLINTAGGLTGGDRLEWQAEAAAGSRLVVTTQACEKLYRSASGPARMHCRLHVGEGASLAWVPQETIVFDRSSFRREVEADLASGARLLLLESAVFGRTAMGERTGHAVFRDRWRVRVDGRVVHAEDFRIGPDAAATLAMPAVAGGGIAIATLLLIGEGCERHVEPLRTAVGDYGGVSHWQVAGTGKLLARLVASSGYALRERLVHMLSLLKDEAVMPRIWTS